MYLAMAVTSFMLQDANGGENDVDEAFDKEQVDDERDNDEDEV